MSELGESIIKGMEEAFAFVQGDGNRDMAVKFTNHCHNPKKLSENIVKKFC